MVTRRQENPETGVLSLSNLALASQPDLEWLERHTGPGLFTHEIYSRQAEQPVSLTRDHLAERLLQVQQIGILRFCGRRWQSRGDDDQADEFTGDHPMSVTQAGEDNIFIDPVANLLLDVDRWASR